MISGSRPLFTPTLEQMSRHPGNERVERPCKSTSAGKPTKAGVPRVCLLRSRDATSRAGTGRPRKKRKKKLLCVPGGRFVSRTWSGGAPSNANRRAAVRLASRASSRCIPSRCGQHGRSPPSSHPAACVPVGRLSRHMPAEHLGRALCLFFYHPSSPFPVVCVHAPTPTPHTLESDSLLFFAALECGLQTDLGRSASKSEMPRLFDLIAIAADEKFSGRNECLR